MRPDYDSTEGCIYPPSVPIQLDWHFIHFTRDFFFREPTDVARDLTVTMGVTSMTARVVGIALKQAHRGPMEEVGSLEVTEKGLQGNASASGLRRVTLISKEQWDETMAELGADLPWHTRRANVLIEGLRAPDLMGKSITVGDIEIRVNGETEPCGRMDELCPGLRKALEPDCRGGVYGSVVKGGEIRVGDSVLVANREIGVPGGG